MIDEPIPVGWYAMRPIAAYTGLDDARADLPKMRAMGSDLLDEAIGRQIDQLAELHAGAGFIAAGDGRLMVIEKLPDGSVIFLATHEAIRADSPGEAFDNAVAGGLVLHNGLMVRYCNALPPGELPASARPPGATAH